MTEPFVAEVRLFSVPALPDGWVACDGRQLSITEHQALFSLIGWRHGGDRRETFGLPALAFEPPLTPAIATDGCIPPREPEDFMDHPYVGEIRLFGGSFTPTGWVTCDGRELPIAAPNLELYELIGKTFGGGEHSFAVPDLRDRAQPGLNFIIALTRTPARRDADVPTLILDGPNA
jgi:microcystin-dependent protein